MGPILKELSIKYRKPVVFPSTLDLYTHTGDVRSDRLHMYTVFCLDGRVVADAKCTVVSYDYRKGAPCPIPQTVVEHMERTEATLPEWVKEHVKKAWHAKT